MKSENIFGIINLIGVLVGIALKKNAIIYISLFILIISITYKNKIKYLNKKIKLNKDKHDLVERILNASTWEFDIKKQTVIFSKNMKENIIAEKEYNIEEIIDLIKMEDREKLEKFFISDKKNYNDKINSIEISMELIKAIYTPIRISLSKKDKKVKGKISGVLIDITEEKIQKKRLEDSEKVYRLAVQGSRDVLFYWNIDDNVITLKGKVYNVITKCKEESLKIPFDKFITYIEVEDRKKLINAYNKCLNKEYDFFDIEFRFIRENGENTWFSLRGKRFNEDEEIYIYGSLSNINDRKEKEARIKFVSYYDYITGLPNRRMFKEKVEDIIEEVNINYRNLAIVFIDIDNFKYINDTYGHEIGDKLLKEISKKIEGIISSDSFLARFGGDEFVILVDNLESFEHLEKVLNGIINECNASFKIEEKDIYCTVSIGVSMFGKDGIDFDQLMKSADLAMYTAKEHGKNKYEFFNDEILKKINREVDIKEGLSKALINEELYGVLQPKYLSETEEIIGFEYLVRWNSKELGNVSPSEFIKIAESTGQIAAIGKFIIKDAMKMCKNLESIMDDNFKIAINLSEVQLRDIFIVDFIKDTMNIYNVNPKTIEIEITESIIMESAEKNIRLLKRLKNLGVTIALDDFGTGYSSLSYLRLLPIDILKIDKSFIDYINKDRKSEYIIETIIELSHCFNFLVVAEGVETREQFEFLKENKCDIIQGYYFSRPLPFGEICEIVKEKIQNQITEKV